MKKTLLFLLLFMFAFTLTKAQVATNFTVSPVVCFNGPGTLAFASITQTIGATGYSWTVSGANGGTCTPAISPSVPGNYLLEMNLFCCGIYTITLNANVGPPVSHTMNVVCPAQLAVVASHSTICAGDSVVLTASGASSYTWSNGQVGPVIHVTPSVTTCYTVMSSNPGCSNSYASICVYVQSANNVYISGPNLICAGTSATLTASGASSYTWQPGGFAGPSIGITPSVSTCYTLYSWSSCTGSNIPVTKCITVGQTGTVTVSGPNSVCAGGSATLVASGATNYTWQPGGATGSVIVVTPSVLTCYTVSSSDICSYSYYAIKCISIGGGNISVSGANSICAGDATTLTASGAANYTWQPGNLTGSSIVVSPTVNTCYSVTGTSSNTFCPGNPTPGALCIFVRPKPLITTASNFFCAGQAGTLAASGASTYVWQPYNLTGSVISIIPSAPGCYTVTGTNSVGCSSSVVSCFSVFPTPSVTVVNSNSVICPGGSATLTAGGASSYTWSNGATGASIVVSPSVSSCYTVTGVSGFGCIGRSVACVMVQAPGLTVSGPGSICGGSTATLTASGAASYTWQPGGFTGSSIVISPSVTTCYTVTGSGNGNCYPAPAVICVTVGTGAPVITTTNPGFFCAGQTGTLTASGAATYTWYPYNLNGSSIVITPSVGMCYTVVGRSSGGCIGSSVNCFSVLPVSSLTVSGTDYVCAGDSVFLMASGANSYTWQPGNYTGAIIHPVLYGNYCYSVTGNSYGCKTTTVKCVTVQPSNLGVVGPYSICSGASATLTGVNAISYTWQPGNLTGPSIVVSPTATTCYTLYGSNPYVNCTITPTIHCVVVNSGPSPTITTVASPNFFCAGQSGTLTASGAASYTWYPYNFTGSSIVITPSVGMCYTVVGTNTTGCSGSAIGCYSVMPTPVITTSGNFPICPGGSSTVTASGANSYTWLPGGSTGATIVVSPSVTTCYTVIGNSFGCTGSAVRCVTVQPAVIFVNGPGSVCAGNSATLTASGSSNYTWQPGGYTGSSIVVSPSVTTCYTVSSSNAGNCQASPVVKCITVQIPPQVTVGGNSVTCQGSQAVLSAGGASTYTWLPGNFTGSFVLVTPSVTTCYTVVGTASNGCIGINSRCIVVDVPPTLTVTGGGVSCSGSTQTLVAHGASTYSWFPTGATGASIVVTPTTGTCYTVVGVTNGGCTGSAVTCFSVFPTPVVSISGNTFVCAGSSTTLTASGASSYSWSNGSTGSSIVVSPTATTCYTVAGSYAGCTGIGYASRCVIVGAAPTVSVSGSSFICPGGAVMLTASGASNYTWSNGAGGPTVVVSPSVSTCYTVIGSNPGCSTTGSFVKCIQVTPAPVITVTGNSLVCAGSTTTLTASGAGSYTWSNGATGSSVVLTPTAPACYTVTGSNGGGCTGMAVKCFSVISSIPLSVSPNQFICQGGLASLIASGASTYLWSNGSTSNAIFVSPVLTTVYSVTGNTGGCSQTKTVAVFVNQNPMLFASSSSPIVCAGSSVTLTAVGANSYTWNNVYTGPSIVISPTATIQYSVVGTNSLGCSGTTTITQIVSPCTGIEAIVQKEGSILMYPNPASSNLTVQSDVTGTINYFVCDVTGREIVKGSFIEKKDLDLSAYANGTYIIRFESASGTMYKKLVIEK